MVQGINKEFIFDDEECVQEYKKIIIEKLKDSNINILAYCIMNNHAHFLIYSPQIEYIVKFMQKINTTYSRFYNKKFNRVGYVYRDRYKSQTIVDRKHLINCLIYIHNNPLKAGIVSRIQDYKYSSYLEFLNGGTIINDKSIKILFGDIPNFRNVFNAIHKNQIEDTFMDVKDTDITQIINKFEEKYNISVDAFKHDKKIMKEFIDIARNETNITLVSLANILDVSKSTVSYYSRL
jgi:REP element-mobilizing transposase RayT